ncbi:transposable element Tcb2 transposase [Trichonephila clavipes]|nr:transposable element Tcb2 transposase [Trichonephila clavipes]
MPLRRFRGQYEQMLQFERGRIIGMMEAGWSVRSGSRRPRQTSRREDRHIVRNARVQPIASSGAIQAQVAPSLGAPLSSRTVLRHLAEEHLESRCPLRVLPLTSKLSLATNPDSISAVMTIVFVCGDPVVNASILPLLHSDTPLPTVGVMVWGVIAYNTRSPIVLIRGPMTAQSYVHDILQSHVLPLMQRLTGAIFQQDNAWPHTARVSQDRLRSVTTLPWPARFSDLSPIEHIWDHLGIPRF